ncbi:MAG: hypothetical protein QOI66_2177 [Myxococcales bacterium]|nr:hypothetical protein [Myxococcales bacterium]
MSMTGGARRCLSTVVLAAIGLSACALNQEGVPPPKNDIFYPGGALVDETGKWLFVTNSNSDLRYNDGTMVAVNLEAAETDRAGTWSACPKVGWIPPSSQSPQDANHCCWDVLDRLALNCDSRTYVDVASTLRIGSFAGTTTRQIFCGANREPCPKKRLFVSVRGNSSITWIDADVNADRKLTCAGSGSAVDECGTDHRITQRPIDPGSNPAATIVDAAKVILPEEPYALATFDERNWLLVGHLRGGAVSLIDIDQSRGQPPSLIGWYGAIVPVDTNGQRGITSLTRLSTTGSFYAGSRYLPRAVGLQMTGQGDNSGAATLDNIAVIGNGQQYVSNLPGSETRGIQFIAPLPDDPFPESGLAFVLQRVPPALLGFQVANQPPVDVLETCNSPTFLDRHGTGINLRLYVTCFEDGQVYVFDPRLPRLVDVIEVGRGPAGLVFSPGDDSTTMFVVGFGANNISVVDIKPGSTTENHVIQRIGFPSPVPR